jgi:hypothetical protein
MRQVRRVQNVSLYDEIAFLRDLQAGTDNWDDQFDFTLVNLVEDVRYVSQFR